MRSTQLRRFAIAFFCYGLLFHGNVSAEDEAVDAIESTSELLPLSWEEVTELDVSTLARKEQTLKNTPAAAFVITSEDIRRSGVTSLAEILRMVPGMNVAKLNAWNWGVSARGFNDLYANKLQVMIDGRSIYDPLVSGVYWGQQNPFLQDIERIEVLRGPSGSLWGANAVNGTINIVTRSARDTQDGLISAGGGSEEQGFGGMRYGTKLSDSSYLRASANTMHRDASIDMAGTHGTLDYGNAQTGNFRLDSVLGDHDKLMVEGNLSRHDQNGYFIGKTSLTPAGGVWRQDNFGREGVIGSLQGNWSHHTDSGHDWQLNMAFTQTDWQLAVNQMSRSHSAVDFQHSLPDFFGHHLLWGLNYQIIADRFDNSLTLGFEPEHFTQHNIGVFLQDQIDLLDDLQLTLGNRVEHFTYTGWESEPNARLMWTPNKQHSLWAAASRAVVLPNRAQHSIRLLKTIPGTNTFFQATANPDMLTENLLAFELGWRWQVSRNLDVDTALFYNIYDRMQGTKFTGATIDDPIPGTLEATVGNYRQVKSYGLELALNYRVTHDWRLQTSYTANQFDVNYDPNSHWFRDQLTEPHANPQQSLSLRSLFNLTNEIELDAWGRYVDRIYVDHRGIPAYFSLDLRLGWHPLKELELSLSGQNLLDNQHPEFSDILYIPVASQIQRNYLAQINWRF